ncbi:MAG TPA: hypothetical protein VHW70_00045, partial [Edaphobacter sp.]|nr:hypothetical protein [Edaphobacter sp.]
MQNLNSSIFERIETFGKDDLVAIRRSTFCSFFTRHLSGIIFLCAMTALGSGGLVAQSATPGAPTQDSQQAAPPANSQEPQMGGVNTAGAHPAVLDSEHRPITAGGFVKNGPIIFQDVAEKAGLTSWKHTMGTPEKRYIIEANGSGVGLI